MSSRLLIVGAFCLWAAAVSAAPAPAPAAQGPGAPVPNPAAEKEAASILSELAAHPSKPAHEWKQGVFLGPQIWRHLAVKDPALAKRGVKTSFVPPGMSAGAEGRTFSPGHDDADFLKSAAVQALAKGFSTGKPRAANQKERDAFYALISFEIKGQPVTTVDAGGESLLVYADKGALWLELSGAPEPAKTAAAPSVSTAPAPGATVESIYTAERQRDPFMRSSAGGVSAKPYSPDDFSIHNLTLRGVMKDKAADYALFTDNNFGVSFVLRRGKLYDAKGKLVPGVTGSMNLRQKTAFLKTAESDVQTFKLGEEGKD